MRIEFAFLGWVFRFYTPWVRYLSSDVIIFEISKGEQEYPKTRKKEVNFLYRVIILKPKPRKTNLKPNQFYWADYKFDLKPLQL
jgi:hypothetical protein